MTDTTDKVSMNDHLRRHQRALNFRAVSPSPGWLTNKIRVSPEHLLAKARTRTATYRAKLDERREPETNVISTALLASLVTAKPDATLKDVVTGMLQRLVTAGYEVEAVTTRCKNLRRRLR